MKKIGIFAPFSGGDLTISTCLLKYINELWPKSNIIWFACPQYYDILKYTPEISEIRQHASHHYGPDVRIGETSGALSENRIKYPDTSDLDMGFFTTPWANPKLLSMQSTPYAFFPRKIIGHQMPEWRPCISFSKEEDEMARDFVCGLPFNKTIMLETISKSGQSLWDHDCSKQSLDICRKALGRCNFIFASPGSHKGLEDDGVVDCSKFTARQCIPIYNRCHLFVSTSSGVGCMTTAWSANSSIPRIEYCHNSTMSTCHLVTGKNELCTNKDNLLDSMKNILKYI